jgi:hypothetical protein
MASPDRAGATPSAPSAAAGKIQMLDLAALKARLGSKWDRMSGPVQMFFEAAIRRNLGLGDSFYRSSELAYVVVFRGLNEAETEVKCTAISEEVCQRLFGENGETITLRNLVGQFSPSELPSDRDHVSELDALLERSGREVLVSRAAPVSDDARDLRIRLINRGTGLQRIARRDIAFAYRPVWDCQKHAVLTYLCQPALGPFQPDTNIRAAYLAADDVDDIAALDLAALQECVRQAGSLRSSGMRFIFAVPVHFSTLSRMKSWQVYSAAYRHVPKDIAGDLAFVVFGIDKGVPHIRLVQELPKLAVGAYRVLCAVEETESLATRFARTGAHGVGLVLSPKNTEAQMSKLIGNVAREAQAATIDAFVLDVPSTSLVLGAVNAGVRYVEGPVVKAPLATPRHAYVHGVEDLYRIRRE